jgi:hypothetical protein
MQPGVLACLFCYLRAHLYLISPLHISILLATAFTARVGALRSANGEMCCVSAAAGAFCTKACSRCKAVAYCSKECQVQVGLQESWGFAHFLSMLSCTLQPITATRRLCDSALTDCRAVLDVAAGGMLMDAMDQIKHHSRSC